MLAMVIILLALFFMPYYLGKEVYIPSSDLAFENYSYWVHCFDYIKEYGWHGWDFTVGGGYGQDYRSNFLSLDAVVLLFGKEAFAYALIWLQTVKVILAASFFYLALRQLKINRIACAYGGTFYAFCAIMIVRSCWSKYALELVLAAFLFFALERYFQKKQWWILILAIVLLGSQMNVYGIVVYALLMFFYANIRYYIMEEHEEKWLSYFGKCAAIMIVSLIILAYKIYPSIVSMFSTSRFESIASTVNTETLLSREFLLGSMARYVAIFNSFFAISLEGNYGETLYCPDALDGPLFYCGILTLLLLPQAYTMLSGKMKKAMGAVAIATLCYFVFPIVTYACNFGVDKDYFKLNTLWIVMLMLTLSAWGLGKILTERRLKIGLLAGTYLVLCMMFLGVNFCMPGVRERINVGMALKVFAFLSIWVLLLGMFQRQKLQWKGMSMLLMLFGVGELYLFIHPTTEVYLSASHVFAYYTNIEGDYYKQNNALIESIKEKEGNQFYRIYFKDENYYSYNTENLLYNFRGTGYASAFVNSGYVNFLQAVETDTDKNPIWRRNAGPKSHYMVNSLLGIKYLILPKTEIPYRGLEEVDGNEGKTVYENPDVLSLGVAIPRVLSTEEFEKLSIRQKDLALLNAVITDEKGLLEMEHYENELQVEERDLDAFKILFENFSESIVESSDTIMLKNGEENGKLYIPLEEAWTEENEYIFSMDVETQEAGKIYVQWQQEQQWYTQIAEYTKGQNRIHVTIDGAATDGLLITFEGSSGTSVTIKNIGYEYSNSGEIDTLYKKAVSERKEGAVVYSEYSDSHMKGSLALEEEAVIFFAIPYDDDWNITVDGKTAEYQLADYGFIGVTMEAGEHEIELEYR